MVTLLAATGMLGTGFSEDSFNRALMKQPIMIGCDAGSTDPGPYYLGTGTSMAAKQSVKRDVRIMLKAAVLYKIPLIIGSAGTGGSNIQVDWLVNIVNEIATEENLEFKLAKIYSQITNELLLEYFKEGKIHSLENAPEINEDNINNMINIVGQIGPEPYIEALKNEAQVIIAGRSSDTSIYTAVPISMGLNTAEVLHAAKIIECGAGCVVNRKHPDSMIAEIFDSHFHIESPNPDFKVTPSSVLSHLMYENASPYTLKESNGKLQTEQSKYIQNGDGVDVYDSVFIPSDTYTIRIEGTYFIGYRRITIAGIRDPFVLKQLNSFLEESISSVNKKVEESLNINKKDYSITVRKYGQNGVLGDNEPKNVKDLHEVGLLFDVISSSKEISRSIMSILWHTILHYPIKEWSGLVSQLAFPFSPPDSDMGEVYEFALNHTIEIDHPLDLIKINYLNI